MKHLLIPLFFLISTPAMAQMLKVVKVKGSQAIVNVSGGTLDVGQTIKVPGLDQEDDLELTASSTGPRKHVIGLSGEYRTGKDTTGSIDQNSSVLTLSGKYGWNTGIMEYGFLGVAGMSDTGGGNTTQFGGGGFFDWNFTPNKAGNDMLWGAGIDAAYIITNPPSGGQGSNTMQFFPSIFLKWFILKTPTAIRGDLGYSYTDTKAGSTTSKAQYIKLMAGFEVYF